MPIPKIEAPPPEKIAGGFQQAGKKEGGLGEGIFARLLTAPTCPPKPRRRRGRKRVARAKYKKLKENCFALLAEVRRAETLGRGFKSFERFSLEKGSSFVQQLRQIIMNK